MPEGDVNTQTQESLVIQVLSRLVRDEYPQDKTLAEIAEIWGNATSEELDALRLWEG